MLSEEVVEALSERLVQRIEEGNIYVLKLLGARINEIGDLIPSDGYRIVQLMKYGGDINKIIKKLSQITDKNVKDIYDIFDSLANKNINFAKQYYEHRNIGFIPYKDNIELQKQVKLLADITVNEYLNITNTTALGFSMRDLNGVTVFKDLSNTYFETLDRAVIALNQGKESYQTIMKSTIQQLGGSSLKTVDYSSGYSRRLDSSVRMNIMDGMRNLHNELQKYIGEDIGYDGIEISVHDNPALDHAPIQGHLFTIEEFDKMQNSLPFKDYKGKIYTEIERHISEYNCYHYISAVILDIVKPQYTEKQLQDILDNNEKGFELDGEQYTNYEGQQMQRKLEALIRTQKDIQIIAKEGGNEILINSTKAKIRELTGKYNELSKVSKLPTKMERLRVYG